MEITRIRQIIKDEGRIVEDFNTLLTTIGFSVEKSEEIIKIFFELIDKELILEDARSKFESYIKGQEINNLPFTTAFDQLMKKRADRIYGEIANVLACKGKILDFGCGNGMVGELLHSRNNLEISGCDVIVTENTDLHIKILKFDGYHLEVPDNNFEAGYANSVLHHIENPERAVKELSRVVSKRFVLIEDTLQGDTKEAIDKHKDRLFVNDLFFNYFLTDKNIPMPECYKESGDWVDMFVKYGFKLTEKTDLGWSKILPAVFRARLVFEK